MVPTSEKVGTADSAVFLQTRSKAQLLEAGDSLGCIEILETLSRRCARPAQPRPVIGGMNDHAHCSPPRATFLFF